MEEHLGQSKPIQKKIESMLTIIFRAWTYGGIAVRMCQELGLHKEETLKAPITAPDGTLDYVAMALRRRIFWSCFCIDK